MDEVYLHPNKEDIDYMNMLEKGRISEHANSYIDIMMRNAREYLSLYFPDKVFKKHECKYIGKRFKGLHNANGVPGFVEYWIFYKPENRVYKIRKEFQEDGAWLSVYTFEAVSEEDDEEDDE